MNKTFQKIKAESKLILERSRNVLAAASEEIQKEYGTIEEVRLLYEKELELAKKQRLPEPDASGVDFRTVDELQAELETQRANLDMNLNTNPGIVEEYEKRKRDVRVFFTNPISFPWLLISICRFKSLRRPLLIGRRKQTKWNITSRMLE